MSGLSAVAGIIDRGGGLRIVVAEFAALHAHVGKGERVFVLPGALVQEPISLDHAKWLVPEVQRYVLREMLATVARPG